MPSTTTTTNTNTTTTTTDALNSEGFPDLFSTATPQAANHPSQAVPTSDALENLSISHITIQEVSPVGGLVEEAALGEQGQQERRTSGGEQALPATDPALQARPAASLEAIESPATDPAPTATNTALTSGAALLVLPPLPRSSIYHHERAMAAPLPPYEQFFNRAAAGAESLPASRAESFLAWACRFGEGELRDENEFPMGFWSAFNIEAQIQRHLARQAARSLEFLEPDEPLGFNS